MDLRSFGYAYGVYFTTCQDCKKTFDGDKRAWRCETCASIAESADRLSHYRLPHTTTNVMSTWDKKYLGLARYISDWSKDPSTKVGAVIADKDHRLVSLGYNGLAQRTDDSPERLNNRDLKYKIIIHGELNAMHFANRSDLSDCTIYLWPFLSCSSCTSQIIQRGIRRVVAPAIPEDLRSRWEESLNLSIKLYEEAKTEVKLVSQEELKDLK